jgi:ABC-type transport system involved in multi-copper enzyme maturation permease subunit
MTSYLKSEFYRLFHSKFTYLFIGISAALLIAMNVVLMGVKMSDKKFPYATTQFAMGLLLNYIMLLFLMCMMIASSIFGNEYNNHTMKNSLSYGISRGTIYFGKLIVEIVYAMISFVIIVGIDLASAYLLLDNSGQEILVSFLRYILLCLPQFLFVIGVTNCFLFIIEGIGGALSAVTGIIVIVPLVCQLGGMRFELLQKISKVLPWNLINQIKMDDKMGIVLPWAGNAGYYNYWIAGILQMILFVLIGYIMFRRTEVK